MTAILIPAYNAAATLSELLQRLFYFVKADDIVVVDDGSGDRTASIGQRAGVKVVRHSKNRGKGAALKTGFEAIKTLQQYDAVVTMDADLQHQPEELPKFLEARNSKRPNVVVGYRARLGTTMPLARRLSNTITSKLVSARTGRQILDSQSGYRLIGREVLDAVSLESDGYEAETELLIKAAQKGFSIEFVPIQTIYGNERSYMTHWHTTKRFLQVLLKDY